MKYRGYTIKRSPAGNYAVWMPTGGFFADMAANLKTAKKWVDAHIIEVCERKARS